MTYFAMKKAWQATKPDIELVPSEPAPEFGTVAF
jgi:hypothetical protein